MVQLHYTTSEFCPNRISTPGVPLLVDNEMNFIEPACLWFFELAIINGRTHSPATWHSYAEALYDWFKYCETNGWQWDLATEGQLSAYRNSMLSKPSDHTGRPYSVRTINGRLIRIAIFYRWALKKGFISELPFEFEDIRVTKLSNRKFLAHTDTTPGVVKANLLTIREKTRIPHALSPDEIRRIQRHLGSRDRLIVQCALTTGMRRKEVLALICSQIPETSQLNNCNLIPIKIVITKGDKPRTTYFPLHLLDRINDYINEERTSVIKKCKKQNQNYVSTDALWLTEQGTLLSKEGLNKQFKVACKKASVNATFHDLRHTYAITMLALIQRQSIRDPNLGINPLKTLQILLGHTHLSSTDIYLQALEPNMTAIEESIEALYEKLI